MPTTSRLATSGSLATTTLLHAQYEIARSNPVAWWWLGETTELAYYNPGLATDLRQLYLFAAGLHAGAYSGSPVFNSAGSAGGGVDPPVVTVAGPQVRNQALETIPIGYPMRLLAIPWPIEAVAVGLDGSARVSFPDDNSLTFGPGDDFAVEGWVSTTVANAPVLAKADSGRWPYAFDVVAGHARASRSDGTHQPAVTSAATVNDGAWHYWLLSKAGGALSLTVDETVATTSDTTAGVRGATATSSPVTIGAGAFSGAVAHFAVYDRAVGATEAMRHYRSMRAIPVTV